MLIFQFPFLGIFALNHQTGLIAWGVVSLFQFPFLGIFRCTAFLESGVSDSVVAFFQFPFLGIFRCTIVFQTARLQSTSLSAFNFRFLGFSVAPFMCGLTPSTLSIFQFPFLGIFRCTKPSVNKPLAQQYQLSIPVSWDFPLPYEAKRQPMTLSTTLIPVSWDFPLHLHT